MLAKPERLKKQADFTAVRQSGHKARSEHLVVFFSSTDADINRAGIVVSSKVAGTAVRRNAVRRRLNTALTTVFNSWGERPHGDMVVIVARLESSLTLSELNNELTQCLQKLF